jgi:hypothetical protein
MMIGLLAAGVAIVAIGFISLILVLNAHLKQLRREFQDLRTFLVAILGER